MYTFESFSTLGLAQLNIWLEGFAVGHTEDEEGSWEGNLTADVFSMFIFEQIQL